MRVVVLGVLGTGFGYTRGLGFWVPGLAPRALILGLRCASMRLDVLGCLQLPCYFQFKFRVGEYCSEVSVQVRHQDLAVSGANLQWFWDVGLISGFEIARQFGIFWGICSGKTYGNKSHVFL